MSSYMCKQPVYRSAKPNCRRFLLTCVRDALNHSIGQTTSVHALARQLLGDKAYATGVLELNASDARGIDVS